MKKTIFLILTTTVLSCSIHTTGTDGKPGENGKTGINGQKGKDGKNGVDGESKVIGLNLSNKNKEIVDGILVGKAQKSDLQQEPFNIWFNQGYNDYTLGEEMKREIQKNVKDYTITIFMGTWCEDSQNQVPKFYKILEEVDFPTKSITLITMAIDKTTPQQFEKGLNITNVPTFIFYKNSKEINRIVESPVISLEQDFLNIVSGKNYKHIYQ
uniref:thioredoxin family protein n=1 Tax=Flavobacterium sp. TaxID=239 RepID=UPI0040499A0D